MVESGTLLHSDFVIPSSFDIGHSSFLVFDHSSPDVLDLRVMSQHVHTPIAPSKKCAQNPAHDADNDRAPERAPEVIYMESDHHTRNDEQQQPV